MKKKQILNILMVLIIIMIAVSGVMVVKSLKGPTITTNSNVQNGEEVPLVISNKSGIVTVERNGIAYEVEENTLIKNEDVLVTKVNSEVSLGENGMAIAVLGANTQLRVIDIDALELELIEGELFVDHRNTEKPLKIVTEGITFVPEGTAFSVTAYKSAYTAYVYSGKVTANGDKLKEEISAEAGLTIHAVADKEGNITAQENPFSARGLSEWQIHTLLECGLDESFALTAEDLDKVIADRDAEKAAAQQALLATRQQMMQELENQEKEYSENYQNYLDSLANSENIINSEIGGMTASASGKSCTIEIRCDTILNNMGNLTAGKEGYVPSNGTILATVQVGFEEGETVFEVLNRVCDSTGIQIEYSWTPMYNSYYIEGINHLYEFDCGAESGWMYKVNGWFPNYGCSSYVLDDGDVIVWCYTCKGLGADVGGSVYGN